MQKVNHDKKTKEVPSVRQASPPEQQERILLLGKVRKGGGEGK
jgi:hypothetical protein